jgi:oligopeptide/dipeptide ABC transporter ATP-binding protein
MASIDVNPSHTLLQGIMMIQSQTSYSYAIELHQVTKTYSSGRGLWGSQAEKVTALDRVDITVRRGEIFGMVGESGSGKTTAGRMMVRLEAPDSGTVKILGEPIGHLKSRALKQFRSAVQMIFQDPYQSLNPYLSVMDTVAEPLRIHSKASKDSVHSRVIQAIETAGLTPAVDYLKTYPHQLSGGQRQRVAIARAMVLDPQVVVADEPTSMLDASIAIQIYQLLEDIQKRRRMTMVLITHNLAAAHYLCDRLAVIYRGHIVETGTTQTIISAPRHPYTQALLDALPRYGNVWDQKKFNTLRSDERITDHSRDGCPFFSRCNRAEEALCAFKKPELKPLGNEHQAACFFAENHK